MISCFLTYLTICHVILDFCLKYERLGWAADIICAHPYLVDSVFFLRLSHGSGGEEGGATEEDIVLQETFKRKGGADVWWNFCSKYHSEGISVIESKEK